MAAKGYTSALLVAQELGLDLTAPQLDQCADLVEGVESFIDWETGRAWLTTSPTTDELHTSSGPLVYLKKRPVTSITSVKVRGSYVGATDTTLAVTEYELLDATNGILNLLYTYTPGWYIRVTYVSSTTALPLDIQRAATLLVADAMQDRLNPDYQGVESYRIAGSGDEFQVKMRSPGAQSVRLDEAMRIIRAREVMVFA